MIPVFPLSLLDDLIRAIRNDIATAERELESPTQLLLKTDGFLTDPLDSNQSWPEMLLTSSNIVVWVMLSVCVSVSQIEECYGPTIEINLHYWRQW